MDRQEVSACRLRQLNFQTPVFQAANGFDEIGFSNGRKTLLGKNRKQQTMANRFATLFEDDLVEQNGIDDHADNDLFTHTRLVAAVACVFCLLVIGYWTIRSWSSQGDSNQIHFRGARAGQLQPGALVVMDDVEVGQVKSVAIEGGKAVANLQLNDDVVNEIPADSRFVVRSLNSIMPGNVGIEIVSGVSALEFQDQRGTSDSILHDIQTSVDVFPTSIPSGFFLLLAAVGIIGAIVFGISWKIARINWLRYALLIGFIVVLVYLVQRGIIASDSLYELFDWASHAIRGAIC